MDSKSNADKSDVPKQKNLGGRPKKSVLYKKEQDEILIKLNNILGITSTNKIFYLCDICEEKQKKIMELKDDVVQYFSGKSYAVLLKSDRSNIQRPYMSLVRAIYKQMGITWVTVSKKINRNDIDVCTTLYVINY